MKTIITEESIDKASDKVMNLSDSAYLKLTKTFMKEQPALSGILGFSQEELGEDDFHEMVDIALVIWQAFKMSVNNLQEVSVETIKKVSDNNDKRYAELEKVFSDTNNNVDLEKLQQYVARMMAAKSQKELDKLAKEMGSQFYEAARVALLLKDEMYQPELYEFVCWNIGLNPENINEDATYEKSFMLDQLMLIVHGLNESLQSESFLVATPGGKLIENESSEEKNETTQVYQLKISLKGITPLIWRRIQVRDDITLDELHFLIQITMGWENCHLYEFKINRNTYMMQDEDSFDQERTIDPMDVCLNEVITKEKQQFEYTYDFGDSWDHKIVVEKILTADPSKNYPICLAGKRNCPPEDCGGIWGYEELLEIMANKKHPEYKEMKEWLGGNFDAEAIDLVAINDELQFGF